MLKNAPPLVSVSLRNGAIAGVLGFTILLALYFLGKHPFLFMIFFDFRIFLFAIFMTLTLKEIRDNYQGGIIFFWQGMIANFLFTTLFACITSFLILVWCGIFPAFLSDYLTTAVEQMKAMPAEAIGRIGKIEYQRNLEYISATNSYILAKHYFWQSFVISFFISIIISVILRRQPKND
ncbi:MAG: DUF4199 domain-containing protein [Cyclobacteriaceae bacterium]